MAVKNDYKCDVHGFFESTKPICPHGCDTVQVVFLQPVGLKSDRTKNNDRTVQQLAMDFNMSDIKSVREGEAQPPRFAPKQPDNPFAVRWGAPNQISQFNTQSINGEMVNGLQAVKSSTTLKGPKTASYIADHQNLSIKDAS
jgi:hypothetical protein